MGADRVSDERLAGWVNQGWLSEELRGIVAELLAIRTEAARGRETPQDTLNRCDEGCTHYSGSGGCFECLKAAIQRDREVGAAAAVALRAERDALREALTRWVAVFDGDDEVLSPADLDLARAALNPPTAGAPEKTE